MNDRTRGVAVTLAVLLAAAAVGLGGCAKQAEAPTPAGQKTPAGITVPNPVAPANGARNAVGSYNGAQQGLQDSIDAAGK